MKTIGLIGGMSWESTVTYYQTINSIVKNELGGFHSAKCLLYSVDFAEIAESQRKGNWQEIGESLTNAAVKLQNAGADFILICTNTMHNVYDQVQAAVNVPMLHIADITLRRLLQRNISKVGLLGTSYTMEQKFYSSRLEDGGVTVIVPEAEDRAAVNDIIYNELCLGTIAPKSQKIFLDIIAKLAKRGSQGIILGCTEIGLLVKQENSTLPLFDTALIHAEEAARLAINN